MRMPPGPSRLFGSNTRAACRVKTNARSAAVGRNFSKVSAMDAIALRFRLKLPHRDLSIVCRGTSSVSRPPNGSTRRTCQRSMVVRTFPKIRRVTTAGPYSRRNSGVVLFLATLITWFESH